MNFLRRCAPYLLPLTFLLAAGVGLLGWALHPAGVRWMLLPSIYLVLLLVDLANCGWAHPSREGAFSQTRFIMRLFITASGLAAVAAVLVILAFRQGYLELATALALRKGTYLAISLAMIAMGNFLPKLPSPWHHDEEPFDWQGVHRFCGILMMLAGVVSFVAWLSMPATDARAVTSAGFVTMAVLAVGRKWYSVLTWPKHSGPRHPE